MEMDFLLFVPPCYYAKKGSSNGIVIIYGTKLNKLRTTKQIRKFIDEKSRFPGSALHLFFFLFFFGNESKGFGRATPSAFFFKFIFKQNSLALFCYEYSFVGELLNDGRLPANEIR